MCVSSKMHKYGTRSKNKNNITEHTLSPIKEQEAASQTEEDRRTILNTLIPTNEQETHLFHQRKDIIPDSSQLTNEQEAAIIPSGDSIIQNTAKPINYSGDYIAQNALHSSNEEESRRMFHWKNIGSTLKSIKQQAVAFLQNDNYIIQNAPTNKQEVSTSRCTEDNINKEIEKGIDRESRVCHLNADRIIENALNGSINEQTATASPRNKSSIIQNALKSNNEQEAAARCKINVIALKLFSKQKATAFSQNKCSVIQQNASTNAQEEASTSYCSRDNIIRNASKSIYKPEATTFPQSESSIIQKASTSEQEASASSSSEDNIIQNAPKSINKQNAITVSQTESIIQNALKSCTEQVLYMFYLNVNRIVEYVLKSINGQLEDALKSIVKQKATTFSQNVPTNCVTRNAPINKQEEATSRYSGDNIVHSTLKSINEQELCIFRLDVNRIIENASKSINEELVNALKIINEQIENAFNSINEREATAFPQNKSNIIRNAPANEQKANTPYRSGDNIIQNVPKSSNEREGSGISHLNPDKILVNTLISINIQFQNVLQIIVDQVENVLKSINEYEAIALSQKAENEENESNIIQNAATSKQEVATSHDKANIIQNMSFNEEKAARPSSFSISQLKCFDKANSAIGNKENEAIFSNVTSSPISTLPESNVSSNTTNRHTNEAFNENLQNLVNDSPFTLNPLKRSKALANFRDVDDSTVPYVLQKKQKQEDKKDK